MCEVLAISVNKIVAAFSNPAQGAFGSSSASGRVQAFWTATSSDNLGVYSDGGAALAFAIAIKVDNLSIDPLDEVVPVTAA